MTELLPPFLLEVWRDLQQPRILWQVLVIAGCLLVGLLLGSTVRRRLLRQGDTLTERARLLQSLARRVILPLSSAALLLVAQWFMSRQGPVNLIHLVNVLLAAWGGIQLVLFGLRQALGSSSLLAAFERPFAWLVWLGVALYLSGLHVELIAWLEATSFPVGKTRLTLLDVISGSVMVLVALFVALWLGALIEGRVMGTERLDMSLRVVLSRVSRAVLIFVAVLFSLSAAGLDLTVLSVFGGALGVGLGFGLQKIASNYVSGFIILLERSLRIGDMVTVNDKYYGAVSQIRTRYSVVRALDGNEHIVPNELLISSPVQNHSWSDRRLRVSQRLQVSYEADVERALEILREVAGAHPRVIPEPAPGAWLVNFAADGLELEAAWFVEDPENGTLAVRSDINREILRRFRAEGISIPYAQRDLRIVSLPPLDLGQAKADQAP